MRAGTAIRSVYEELAETAINGHMDTGFDRPLQLAEDQGYEREIAARDEAIAGLQQQVANLQVRADPGLQQRIAQIAKMRSTT